MTSSCFWLRCIGRAQLISIHFASFYISPPDLHTWLSGVHAQSLLHSATRVSLYMPHSNRDQPLGLPRSWAASPKSQLLHLTQKPQGCNHVRAACGHAEAAEQQRLVAVVDRGIVRSHALDMPPSPSGSRFRQQCLRKMYVLCSRGVESQGPQSCLLQVESAYTQYAHLHCCSIWARRGWQCDQA